MEYLRAAEHQIKRKGSATIKARVPLIYRVMDVAAHLRMFK